MQTGPEECVYTITSYPDYSDKAQYIITYPAVNVFGLTVKPTAEEIETAMKNTDLRL